MADIVYQAQLDDSQVLKALQNIDKNIDKLAQSASRDFQKVGKSAQVSGIQIGLVSGAIQELTRRIINMAETAVSSFVNMTQQAVQLAAGLETTGKIFEGILGEGSEAAAVGALEHIRAQSRELGIDLAETSRAFLPFVASLEELDRVNRIGAALAISQPEQGELGARIALQEALSGNVQSLVRRFEIPKTLGKELQKALDEGGVAEFLDTFENIMKRMGRDVDNLTDTFQFAFGRITQNVTQLQTSFGVPITDELKGQLNELDTIFKANFDDFEALATKAGEVIASILDTASIADVGQFFADNKDEIYQFLEALQQVVSSAKELVDIDLSKGFNVDKLTEATLKVNMIIDGLKALSDLVSSTSSDSAKSGFIGGLQGALSALFPQFDLFIKLWNNLDEVIRAVIATYGLFVALGAEGAAVLNNSYQEFLLLTGQINDSQKQLIDPQKAYNDVITQTNVSLADYKKNTKEAADAVENAIIPTKASTKAAEDLANARIATNKATADLAKLEDEYADAESKVNEKKAEAEKDSSRKLEDIDIQTERKRLDIAIEFAQKREDAATDNLRKLEDIREKYSDDVDDAAIELERKEEDIARKFGEQKIDKERERRAKRVEIERDFRLKIQDIQRQFLLDAEEAEQKRDAVAFIRALKDRDKKVQDANLDRTTEIQELRISNQLKTEELRLQQERELEEARIANERKLEDLATNLDRQIEEQNENYGQQLEDLSLAESRKNEELNTWREREIEDANTAYARKLEDLKVALAEELAIIAEFAAQKAALLAEANTNSVSSSGRPSSGSGSSNPASAGFGATPNTISTASRPQTQFGFINSGGNRGLSGMAVGGPVSAGHPYIVGERGPELFTPSQGGMITPNNAMTIPNFGGGGGMTNITTNNSKSASLGGLLDAGSLDAILAAKVQNQLLALLDRMS